ncbi:hypothetical protein EYC80_006254 [Monilinia laxa]|uniref:Uncharacterized protein n=1 Tax=Monilinia laxa TaxID=61186 RepID=A0A5N6KH07_MONLA|nr:hypothetical protein EYC80_006254 [Monilinia laxa]
MATESKSTPCELINTYYQVCNHVTTSLRHASRIIPSKSSEHGSSASSDQIITTCPQAVYNLSLPPPLNQRQKSETTLCPSVYKRTTINSGYGCPECEPEYHSSTDYIRTEADYWHKKAVDNKDRRKNRFEWCMLAIREWEVRKNTAGTDSEKSDPISKRPNPTDRRSYLLQLKLGEVTRIFHVLYGVSELFLTEWGFLKVV